MDAVTSIVYTREIIFRYELIVLANTSIYMYVIGLCYAILIDYFTIS